MSLIKRNQGFVPSLTDYFENLMGRNIFDMESGLKASLPACNVKETDKTFEVELAVPGMKKEDFDIHIENNMLSISCEKKEEHTDENRRGRYTRREFSYSSFRRTFSLPASADADKIDASYKNGMLDISIKKKEGEANDGAKRIDIH
ncbi:heat-shock protein [Fulvitalea axinellae]|uniref:Heat-shock protein n=1 Tax=Fulvitalea axinellae TaxID=1182444 RepID=A0AAU9CJP8_9BACT|nr:heat-shock protein [Fulvitalea axinellae]